MTEPSTREFIRQLKLALKRHKASGIPYPPQGKQRVRTAREIRREEERRQKREFRKWKKMVAKRLEKESGL